MGPWRVSHCGTVFCVAFLCAGGRAAVLQIRVCLCRFWATLLRCLGVLRCDSKSSVCQVCDLPACFASTLWRVSVFPLQPHGSQGCCVSVTVTVCLNCGSVIKLPAFIVCLGSVCGSESERERAVCLVAVAVWGSLAVFS